MKNKLVFYLTFVAVIVIFCLSMLPVIATENEVTTAIFTHELHSFYECS